MLLETPPVGRYLGKLNKKVEEKPNKDKTGTNIVYEFAIADGDFQGKTFTEYCPMSHELGVAKMYSIHVALTGDTNEFPQFDPTEYEVGLQCIMELDHEMYKGNKQAKIERYLPLKNPVTGEATALTSPF